MEPGDRRDSRVTEQVTDPLVAILVGDLRLPLLSRRVGSRAENARARGDHSDPEIAQNLG
jgi:hypothetical protein